MESFQAETTKYTWKPELKDKFFFFALCPFLFVISTLWFLVTALLIDQLLLVRIVGYLSLLAIVFFCLSPQRGRKKVLILVMWATFMLTRISPVDVSLENYPGPPHLVKLAMGLPTEKGAARARRSEVMLGGCLVNGYEPKWVWVW
jgi:hypothetical protein